MDYRKALPIGTILTLPGMRCTLEGETGRGSNAIVYKGWYPDLLNPAQRHVVLIKELFPLHAQGAIYRREDGSIACLEDGKATMQLHRRSFECGNAAHLALLERYPEQTGANLNTFALNDTLYTVLGFSGGCSLEQALNSSRMPDPNPAGELRRLARRMTGVLDALEAFHESGLLHLDIAPDNILLIGSGHRERVVLIDYNSVHDIHAVGQDALPYSIKSGYTAPEVRSGRSGAICPATDLYSVAAVFYRCLTGAALTPFQMIRPVPPDVSECPAVADMPETVKSWIQTILQRGLHALPRRRYASTAEMREAFRELIDRIDGVGVTHWALWEAGRRSAERIVRDNPSLSFIRDGEALFPSNAESGGQVAPMDEYIRKMLAVQGKHALLIAPGGMGKTTAMLRAAFAQVARYSPDAPAMAYVSLHDWDASEHNYILNSILRTLRFKPEMHSFEDARAALVRLLESPPLTSKGRSPVLMILLDGLNEASGETQGLTGEILTLSRMPGVRLLVSTRTDEPALPFARLRLAALTQQDVQAALSRRGLLMPEAEEMRTLLRTPLMLSIFLQSAQAEERQLAVRSQDELMQAYFEALRRKELACLPEDTDIRWQIDAALRYVLPALAAGLERSGRAMQDSGLLAIVTRCYRLISSRMLRRAFPEWIGYSAAIKNGAGNAEEWYGQIVHDLLWKRLGLLVRGENGAYQVSHQIISEYLVSLDRRSQAIFRRVWLRRLCLGLAAIVALSGMGAGVYSRFIRPQPYGEIQADTAFSYALGAYVGAGSQYDAMRALVDCAIERPQDYESQLWLYAQSISFAALTDSTPDALRALEDMLETGEVMPWSNQAMDEVHFRQLATLVQSRTEEYALFEAVLSYVMQDARAMRLYGDTYPALLSDLIEIDADIAARLYQIVCAPHVSGKYAGDSPEAQSYASMLASAVGLNAHLSDTADSELLLRDLTALTGARTAAVEAIYACGAVAAYEMEGA